MNEHKQRIRNLMLDIIAEPSDEPVRSLDALKQRVTAALYPEDRETKQSDILVATVFGGAAGMAVLSENEWKIFSEVYWDLVIERKINPGLDSSNREFNWFRIHSEYSPQRTE